MFGKIMSISDEIMWRYFELLSFRPLPDIAALRDGIAGGRNPRDVKFELAREIVARFHSEAAADQAQRDFITRVSEKAVPTDLPPKTIGVEAAGIRLGGLLKEAGLAASSSEANRKIDEGAVRIDGQKVMDRAVVLQAGADHVIQLGSKRFARVQLVLKA
jgi:tyrosyl-tRNA synthetase